MYQYKILNYYFYLYVRIMSDKKQIHHIYDYVWTTITLI